MLDLLENGQRDDPALVTSTGSIVSFSDLDEIAREWEDRLTRHQIGVGILFFRANVTCVSAYVAALRCGVPLILAAADADEATVYRLIRRFRPDALIEFTGGLVEGFQVRDSLQLASNVSHKTGSGAALVMLTSGSLGSPKGVMLSDSAVDFNCRAIALALGVRPSDRAVTSLPLNYCYGLSVLNAHLISGASTLLTSDSPSSKSFWKLSAASAVTHFAGVPSTFEGLRSAVGVLPCKSLRTITQAGGRLSEGTVRHFVDTSRSFGQRFFAMYGQTEATARISMIDLCAEPNKIGSAGRVIQGLHIELSEENELVVRGPSVMLGYADNARDLVGRDSQNGVLNTGDIAEIDSDEVLWIRGRLKRIAKIGGVRVSLDELECVSSSVRLATLAIGDGIVVASESPLSAEDSRAFADAARRLKISSASIRVVEVPEIPLLTSGKIDYVELARQMNESD